MSAPRRPGHGRQTAAAGRDSLRRSPPALAAAAGGRPHQGGHSPPGSAERGGGLAQRRTPSAVQGPRLEADLGPSLPADGRGVGVAGGRLEVGRGRAPRADLIRRG